MGFFSIKANEHHDWVGASLWVSRETVADELLVSLRIIFSPSSLQNPWFLMPGDGRIKSSPSAGRENQCGCAWGIFPTGKRCLQTSGVKFMAAQEQDADS